jgi:chromosome segregation ATPase
MTPLTLEGRVRALESDVHQLQHAEEAHTESHALIDTKLDDLSGQVRALTHEIRTEVVPRLDGIDGRLDGIDGRLDGIDGRLDRLETDVAVLKTDMTDVKSGVAALLDHFGITPPPAAD